MRRHRIIRRILALFLSLLLVGFLCFAFLGSQWFRVRHVAVPMLKYGSNDKLKSLIDPVLGENIFLSVFKGGYLDLIQSNIPSIQEIKWVFVNQSDLSLEVVEKEPWISILDQGKSVFIARDGSFLRLQEGVVLENIDKLMIVKGITVDLDSHFKLPNSTVQYLRKVIDQIYHYLPEMNLQLEYLPNDQWIVLKDDTLPILLGNLDVIDSNFKLLTVFLKGNHRKNINYIDARVEDRVFVKYGS